MELNEAMIYVLAMMATLFRSIYDAIIYQLTQIIQIITS